MFYSEQGFSDYYDATAEQTPGISGLDYNPSTASVGSGVQYFPGDVSQDAAALNYVGFLPEQYLLTLNPSTGSQKSDMSAQAGAWDPAFRQAVKDFQEASALTADGWIGPATRTRLKLAVATKNALGSPIAPPYIPPAPPIVGPSQPSSPSSPKAPAPAAEAKPNYALFGGIAAAGAAALYGLYRWVK